QTFNRHDDIVEKAAVHGRGANGEGHPLAGRTPQDGGEPLAIAGDAGILDEGGCHDNPLDPVFVKRDGDARASISASLGFVSCAVCDAAHTHCDLAADCLPSISRLFQRLTHVRAWQEQAGQAGCGPIRCSKCAATHAAPSSTCECNRATSALPAAAAITRPSPSLSMESSTLEPTTRRSMPSRQCQGRPAATSSSAAADASEPAAARRRNASAVFW